MEPPGFAKSLFTSVMWLGWEWLRRPQERTHCLSGSNSVRIRDAKRCRDLIQSDWYNRVKSDLGWEWTLSDDENRLQVYSNTEGGQRISDVIGGKVIGQRADKQLLDDPNDAKEATRGNPERIRERMREVVRDWDDVLIDRLNDEVSDPRVLIMQRLHPDDLAGELKRRDDYEVIEVRQEVTEPSHIMHPEWDPRAKNGTREGERLAFPERFPQRVVDERKKSSIYEATNNQNPSPPAGGLVQKEWFHTSPNSDTLKSEHLYDKKPDPEDFDWVSQTWDFSGGSKSSDASYCVGHILGVKDVTWWLWPFEMRERARYKRMKEMVRELTRAEPNVRRKVVEDKSSGRQIIQEMESEIPGIVHFDPASAGSKDERADIACEVFETGDFMLPAPAIAPWIHDWVREFIDGMTPPNDRIDTLSQGILYYRKNGTKNYSWV